MLALLAQPPQSQAPVLERIRNWVSKQGGRLQGPGNMKDADNITSPAVDFEPEDGSNWGKGEALTLKHL